MPFGTDTNWFRRRGPVVGTLLAFGLSVAVGAALGGIFVVGLKRAGWRA